MAVAGITVGFQDYLTAVAVKALLAIGTCIILHRLFLHSLSKFPGPRLAAVTGLWRTYHYMKGNWHDDILNLHQKYGKVVRIAPNELSIVDEQASKQLYGHGQSAAKTTWYRTWDFVGSMPSVFTVQDRNVHSFLRKRVSSAYSMTSILKYEVYIQGCLDILFTRLDQRAEAGVDVNMSVWTNAFAFDVVGEMAFGHRLGHLETETDVMVLRKNIYKSFQILPTFGYLPFQSRLLQNPVVSTIGKWLGYPDVLAAFTQWSRERVGERMAEMEKGIEHREDMLAHFCRMTTADGRRASPGEVLQEAMNIVGAGADTTSIAMLACLFYVAQNPEVYSKLQREIDLYYTSKPLHQPITYLQTQELPYLMAVVREATRMFPSITFQLPRYAPADFAVDGRSIPAGTPVGVSPIAHNRDQGIWGADADSFIPERWLVEPAHRRHLESCDMTFGGNGPRTCIGRNIALIELHKFLAQFVRGFDFAISDEERPWSVRTYWLSFQHDFNMRLTKRHI